MGDLAAVAEPKVKRPTDYDDVVRYHLKTVGNRTALLWTPNSEGIAAKRSKQ